MSRKPRIHYPAALYHVILRGNARQDIFFGDEDRCRFLLLLQEGVERYGHRIHAFCLMTNHVHLAIQAADVPLSRIMQNVTFRYTRWINWRQKRNGHLFQGRFKAVLVDADAYLSELIRYIHLNPVRAHLVDSPEEYPWSSHRAYLGKEIIPWLSSDLVLSQFNLNEKLARVAYAEFLTQEREEGHVLAFHCGSTSDSRVLGDDTFIETVLTRVEACSKPRISLDMILRSVCGLYGISEQELAAPGKYRRLAEARGVSAWLILETGTVTLSALSRFTGRDVSTLSSAAKLIHIRSASDHAFAVRLGQLMDCVDCGVRLAIVG